MQANTTVLLVGENRRTAEGFTQTLTIRQHQLVATAWQHTLVVRELAVYQLRSEGELARGSANVMLAKDDADGAILLGEQARQFKNTFARHNHLMLVGLLDAGFHGAHGQAVTIGGDGAQDIGANLKKHAVEVIPHVLLSHSEAGALDQTTQLALNQSKRQRALAIFHRWEIVGRQSRQGKTAAAGLDDQLLLIDANVDQRVVRQALTDVH